MSKQQQQTNKRKNLSNSTSTLGSLLKYMEGMEIIVELKTGKRLHGILSSAGNDMNLTLEQTNDNALHQKGDEDHDLDQQIHLLSVHIRGSNIRCIQFPDNADLKGLVASGAERERAAANKYKRGKRK
jgi:small nuclear ribonucleoprotein (snRNP)-like protein